VLIITIPTRCMPARAASSREKKYSRAN
jgi:hypothetical protein